MVTNSAKGHSEEYFGDYRDFWWNLDFIELLARRWRLSTASTLLDVGSGLCHWSLLLSQFLGPDRQITALDSDQKWAAGNDALREKFASLGASVAFIYGDASRIPVPTGTFDVVTCQTVLLHSNQPSALIHEMKRVVKPGGIVICAEPNNLAGTASMDSIDLAIDVGTVTDKFRERLIYERGRAAAGEGNMSLGDQLPFLFKSAGFEDLQCYISDRLNPLYPPYDYAAQKADIAQARKSAGSDTNSRNELIRYATALDSPDDLAFIKSKIEKPNAHGAFLKAIDDGTFFSGGLSVMYVVSGRK